MNYSQMMEAHFIFNEFHKKYFEKNDDIKRAIGYKLHTFYNESAYENRLSTLENYNLISIGHAEFFGCDAPTGCIKFSTSVKKNMLPKFAGENFYEFLPITVEDDVILKIYDCFVWGSSDPRRRIVELIEKWSNGIANKEYLKYKGASLDHELKVLEKYKLVKKYMDQMDDKVLNYFIPWFFVEYGDCPIAFSNEFYNIK